MPNLPISQLPELTAITRNAEFAVAQDGVTYKIKAGLQSSGNLFGAFYSTVTQDIISGDTVYVISAETTYESYGVSVVDNSKFTVASGGTYNIQISAVFNKLQGGTIEYISLWFRKNGIDIPWSNTDVSMANNNEFVVEALNFITYMDADDYLEILWSSTSDQMEMKALLPQTNPTRPGTPSIIVTVTQV